HLPAEGGPQLFVVRADRDVGVPGAIGLVRCRAAMTGARGNGYLAAAEVGAGLPESPGETRFQERRVQVPAFAGLQSLDVGGEDRIERSGARGDVVRRAAHLGGAPARLAGHGHDAAHALRDDVESALLAVGPGLAEARDGAIDDVGVDRPDRLVVDTELTRHAGAVVFDDDVGVAGEFQ